MHEHHHEANHPLTSEEAKALLQYMVGHNLHHAEELHELAHSLNGQAAELMHSAVHDLEQGNEKLSRALELL